MSHSSLKLQSIEADLQDQRLVTLLSAVALLYFRVTGPYWKLLQSDVRYTRFHIYVQKMATLFTHGQTDPFGILDPAFVGIFDGEFEVDCPTMLERVPSSACHETPLVLVCFKAIFQELLAVTQRQLADFLMVGKFGHEPTEEDKAILSHCPLTNLTGENAFGDMDFNLGKRRHCNLHHRTTTHMLKRNKTSKWLDSKAPAESSSILKTAKKNAKMLRRKHREQERLVKMKIKE